MLSSLPAVPAYDPKTNFCDFFPEPIQLVVIHDQIELRGHFKYISPSDFSVVLDAPYSGLSAGYHTPSFAMLPQNRNIVRGQLTSKCIHSGQTALISAYKRASSLYANREMLYHRIKKIQPQIELLHQNIEEQTDSYLTEKRRFRSRFKAGSLTEAEYTSFIKASKAKIDALRKEILALQQALFSDFQLKYGEEEESILFVKRMIEAPQ